MTDLHIRIYFPEGRQAGSLFGNDAGVALEAIGDVIEPTTLRFMNRYTEKPVDGDYFKVTATTCVELDDRRKQFFHEGQILVIVRAENTLH